MITHSLSLPPEFDGNRLDDLRAYLPYCTDAVSRVALSDTSRQLEFTCRREEDEPTARKALETIVRVLTPCVDKSQTAAEPAVPPHIAFDNRGVKTLCREAIFPRLLAEGHLFECGPGLYGMGKLFLQTFKYFERACHRLVMELQPEEFVYPTLIPIEQLQSGGRGEAAGHHATYVTTRTLEGESSVDEQGMVKPAHPFLEVPDHACKWAICLHCYPQFQNKILDTGIAITSQGRCFRVESRGYKTIERLWEFIMREIVFMGSRDYVRAGLLQVRERTADWMRRLGLHGWIESAEDPFFADPNDPPLYRLIADTKQELRLTLQNEGEATSVGSFNFHGPHFSRRFHILHGNKNEYAATGCAGFGIERLTYAFLSQYGLDPAVWPDSIRKEVLLA
jgi:hypothetical protein